MKAILFGALLVQALNAQGIDDFLASPDVTTTEEGLAPLITPGINAPSEADLLSPNGGVEVNDAGVAVSVTAGAEAEITPSLDGLTSEVTSIADAIPLDLPVGTADVIVDTPTFNPFATTSSALGSAETAAGVADSFDTTGWAWPTPEPASDAGLEPTETLVVGNGFENPATVIDENFPAATEAAPEGEFNDPSTVVDNVPVDDSGAVPSDTDVFADAPTATDDFGLEPTAAPEFDPNGEIAPVADAATDDLGLSDLVTATEDPLLNEEPTAPADVNINPDAGVFDTPSTDDTVASATDAAAAVTDTPTLDLGPGPAATPTLNLEFTNFPAVLSDISDFIFPTPTVDFNAGVSGGARVGGLAASEDPAAPSLDVPLSDDLAVPTDAAESGNLAAAASSDRPVDVPISEDIVLATVTSESGAAALATDVPAELTAVPPQPGLVASTAPTATDSAGALSDPDVTPTPGASSDSPGISGQSSDENNVDAQGGQQGGSGSFAGEDSGVYDGQDYGEDWDENSPGGDYEDDGDWDGRGGKGGHRPHPDLIDCPWWCFEDGNDPGPEAWYHVGPVIKRPHGERSLLKREEPASGGFESFNYPNAGDNDIPEWLWDQSGKRPSRPGPAKQCPWKCYHPRPRPTRTHTHHPKPTTRRPWTRTHTRKPWTRTHTWHPWTSTHQPESTTAEPTQITTTTLVTKTKTRHHHSPFTSVFASDIDWTGDTLATICPKTCNPFDPRLNFCDSQTTGCTTTGGKKYYCACRAGYRASKWNAKDFSKQFHVPGQPYVYVAPGVVCDKLCGDQTCTEVLLRPHCL